jgi:hypothetical protein
MRVDLRLQFLHEYPRLRDALAHRDALEHPLFHVRDYLVNDDRVTIGS